MAISGATTVGAATEEIGSERRANAMGVWSASSGEVGGVRLNGNTGRWGVEFG